jgi:hypothetical protein
MEQYYHQNNLNLRKQHDSECEDAYDIRIFKLQRLIKNIDLTKHILDAKDVFDRFLYKNHVSVDLRKIIFKYFGPSNIEISLINVKIIKWSMKFSSCIIQMGLMMQKQL